MLRRHTREKCVCCAVNDDASPEEQTMPKPTFSFWMNDAGRRRQRVLTAGDALAVVVM